MYIVAYIVYSSLTCKLCPSNYLKYILLLVNQPYVVPDYLSCILHILCIIYYIILYCVLYTIHLPEVVHTTHSPEVVYTIHLPEVVHTPSSTDLYLLSSLSGLKLFMRLSGSSAAIKS